MFRGTTHDREQIHQEEYSYDGSANHDKKLDVATLHFVVMPSICMAFDCAISSSHWNLDQSNRVKDKLL